MREIREEVVVLAIQVAERVVQRNLNEEVHQELAKRFVSELKKA